MRATVNLTSRQLVVQPHQGNWSSDVCLEMNNIELKVIRKTTWILGSDLDTRRVSSSENIRTFCSHRITIHITSSFRRPLSLTHGHMTNTVTHQWFFSGTMSLFTCIWVESVIFCTVQWPKPEEWSSLSICFPSVDSSLIRFLSRQTCCTSMNGLIKRELISSLWVVSAKLSILKRLNAFNVITFTWYLVSQWYDLGHCLADIWGEWNRGLFLHTDLFFAVL